MKCQAHPSLLLFLAHALVGVGAAKPSASGNCGRGMAYGHLSGIAAFLFAMVLESATRLKTGVLKPRVGDFHTKRPLGLGVTTFGFACPHCPPANSHGTQKGGSQKAFPLQVVGFWLYVLQGSSSNMKSLAPGVLCGVTPAVARRHQTFEHAPAPMSFFSPGVPIGTSGLAPRLNIFVGGMAGGLNVLLTGNRLGALAAQSNMASAKTRETPRVEARQASPWAGTSARRSEASEGSTSKRGAGRGPGWNISMGNIFGRSTSGIPISALPACLFF